MTPLSRRRFIGISAAAGGLVLGSAAQATQSVWRGQALGAKAEVRLRHLEAAEAAPIFASVRKELSRLERVFSLYDRGSALTTLNAEGMLADPPPELVELLTLARGIHGVTDGLFDPSVQPIFSAFALGAVSEPDPALVAAAIDRTGFEAVSIDDSGIRLNRSGMALTLNGIAQGYMTDRIAALLRQEGLTDVLVDAGEIASRGNSGNSAGWEVGIAGTTRRLTLCNAAIATSAPMGTILDPARGIGHIVHPRQGWVRPPQAQVSVVADSAALADGLSTAAVLMSEKQLDALRARGHQLLAISA